MGSQDTKDVPHAIARAPSQHVGERSSPTGAAVDQLEGPKYVAQSHALEAGYPAGQTAWVEARRRMRLGAQRKEHGVVMVWKPTVITHEGKLFAVPEDIEAIREPKNPPWWKLFGGSSG